MKVIPYKAIKLYHFEWTLQLWRQLFVNPGHCVAKKELTLPQFWNVILLLSSHWTFRLTFSPEKNVTTCMYGNDDPWQRREVTSCFKLNYNHTGWFFAPSKHLTTWIDDNMKRLSWHKIVLTVYLLLQQNKQITLQWNRNKRNKSCDSYMKNTRVILWSEYWALDGFYYFF